MTAVGAPDLRRLGLGFGDADALRDEHRDRRHDDPLDALAVAKRVGRVDDVVARRSEMHEALRLIGHLRADDVHEGAHVVARPRLLFRDLLGGDAIGSARDRVGNLPIAEPDVGER